MTSKGYKPITLLTDFGQDDTFVGIMKGVILGILPQASIVDLCHNLPRFDIAQAAFLIHISYRYFPVRTVHLVVVDPGVGSQRRALLVTTDDFFFVAPDNGVLSYIFESGNLRRVFEITARHYFLSAQSSTFHGRDVFAPVAAYLCKGIEPEAFGPEIRDFVKIVIPSPRALSSEALAGKILHIDRFGNLITNISVADLFRLRRGQANAPLTIRIGDQSIGGLRSFYGQGERGKLEAVVGSSGYLEIFVNQGNASLTAQKGRGDQVVVSLLSSQRR